jgi:hypothetical protein
MAHNGYKNVRYLLTCRSMKTPNFSGDGWEENQAERLTCFHQEQIAVLYRREYGNRLFLGPRSRNAYFSYDLRALAIWKVA